MVLLQENVNFLSDFDFYSYGLINGLLHDYLICDGMEHRITACQYTNVTVEHNYPGWGISCITG